VVEQHEEPSQAIRHALAAGDVERAAGLVELAIPALRRNRQEATIRGWLDAIPGDVVRVRPVLAVGFIGALMAVGEFEGVEDRLRDVERWLEPTGDRAGTVVVDEGELARLPGAVEMYRAGLALVRGDPAATIDHAQRAIHRAAEQDDLTRAGASALLGLARWGRGDLEAAHRAYSVAAEGLRRSGYIADVLGCSITLADIRSAQGRLSEALGTYEQALRLASNQDGTVLRGTADMHVGMSQVACERGDLAAPPGTCCAPRSWASTPGCRRTPIAGGPRWRGSGKRREMWTAPSTCWRRRSACTRATSPRTCGRYPGAAGPRAGRPRSGGRGPRVGAPAGPVGHR
jgi:LuxR family transcriptional regulator, maltose regulon positive regulatory protein